MTLDPSKHPLYGVRQIEEVDYAKKEAHDVYTTEDDWTAAIWVYKRRS